MLGNLINIMQVKLKLTIINIWHHCDVHTFSQNLRYAIRCVVWRKQNHADVLLFDRRTITSHLSSHLSPLTLEVVRAPQMTLQQYLYILPCLPLPSGNLQTPFPFIPWCYLPISSSVFLSFLPLSNSYCSSEPFACAAIEQAALWALSYRFSMARMMLALMLYLLIVAHKALCHTLSKAFWSLWRHGRDSADAAGIPRRGSWDWKFVLQCSFRLWNLLALLQWSLLLVARICLGWSSTWPY